MPGDKLARDVWHLLVDVTIEQHRDRYERVTSAADVSMPQAQALLELDPERPVPMSVLAQCLHNDPSNITGIVDRLEAKGLVARQAHPTDRRVKTLVLTTFGRQVRARLRRLVDEPPAALGRLSATELRRLRDLLARLADGGEAGRG